MTRPVPSPTESMAGAGSDPGEATDRARTCGATYALVTAARNEATDIERTLASVLAQSHRPVRWAIVSDGSTDGTDEIVRRYASRHEWITFLRREKPPADFDRVEEVSPGKAPATAMGWDAVSGFSFDCFVNLDADVSFPPDLFERLMRECEADPAIGLSGVMLRNRLPDGSPAPGGFLRADVVGGPIQVFRRECWEAIGGYRPYGHEDGIANDMVKRLGWKVRSHPHLTAYHHVPYAGYAPTIRSKVPTCFKMGVLHYVGREPLWKEALRALRRAWARPWFLAGAAMFLGYVWGLLSRKSRIPREACR